MNVTMFQLFCCYRYAVLWRLGFVAVVVFVAFVAVVFGCVWVVEGGIEGEEVFLFLLILVYTINANIGRGCAFFLQTNRVSKAW